MDHGDVYFLKTLDLSDYSILEIRNLMNQWLEMLVARYEYDPDTLEYILENKDGKVIGHIILIDDIRFRLDESKKEDYFRLDEE